MKLKKLLSAIFAIAAASAAFAKQLPNIVLVLSDDFGYGSLNSYGASEKLIQTPNMDSIGNEGIRFTNAHAPSSVSSPTRYAVLTGRYPWRTEMKFGVWGFEPLLISRDTLTLQRMLKSKGYATACIGKWHLGYGDKRRKFKDMDFRDDLTAKGVNSTGFDYSFTIPQNHGDLSGIYLENDRIWGLRSNNLIDCGKTVNGVPFTGYDAPQRVDEEVLQKLNEKTFAWLDGVPKDKPFFLYYPTPAVHAPITPSKKNAGKSPAGAYGDFVMDLDDAVGDLISYLKKRGQYDNTIFIFTSDNGAQHCAPTYDRTKKNVPILNHVQDANNAGFYPNGNLTLGKTFITEGGTRVPFMVRWPGHIPEGVVSDQAFSLVDIMATLAGVVDYKLDKSAPNGTCDSYDVFDIWRNKKMERPNIITAGESGIRAIRNGNVKYIDGRQMRPKVRRRLYETKPSMYDLNTDLKEAKDISADNPELAKKLEGTLNKIMQEGTSFVD